MSILIKSVLLTGVLMFIFIMSGWLANWMLVLTGCVYVSSGVFSMVFLALGAGVSSIWDVIWDFMQHIWN